MTAHIQLNEANLVLSKQKEIKMNELNNTIINNLRNESLKIYKELSNTEDIVKKSKTY